MGRFLFLLFSFPSSNFITRRDTSSSTLRLAPLTRSLTSSFFVYSKLTPPPLWLSQQTRVISSKYVDGVSVRRTPNGRRVSGVAVGRRRRRIFLYIVRSCSTRLAPLRSLRVNRTVTNGWHALASEQGQISLPNSRVPRDPYGIFSIYPFTQRVSSLVTSGCSMSPEWCLTCQPWPTLKPCTGRSIDRPFKRRNPFRLVSWPSHKLDNLKRWGNAKLRQQLETVSTFLNRRMKWIRRRLLLLFSVSVASQVGRFFDSWKRQKYK